MKSIKGVNTTPELIVRKFLFKKGFRFSLHKKNLPGTPDIVLKKYKTVIFVNGCFWHGHLNCKKSGLPKSRTEFWKSKIEKNVNRDLNNNKKLKSLGWNVIIIHQCEIKNQYMDETMENVTSQIKSMI